MADRDRAALVEQYATADNLEARIDLHETYEVADREWWPWVFDHFDVLGDDATVLEVGCGTGRLWQDNAGRIPPGWDLLATDFSPGMAAETRAALADAGVDAAVGVAAAEALPLPEESVDAVVANHMLYHVDRDAAIPEIRRVLTPGGRLFASTNGESNMRKLRDIRDETTAFTSDVGNFTLENGAGQLAEHFETVERYERDAVLRVPELEPLVAYVASLSGVTERQVAAFADRVEEHLTDGPMEIQKSMGVLVAETPR